MNDFITFPNSTVTSIALGRFDGLHKGHFALFNMLDANGAIVLIDTGKANLTPPCIVSRLANLPVAKYELAQIANKSPQEFIELLHKDFLNLKTIVIGSDFRFGNNRLGNAAMLQKLFSGQTIVIDEVMLDGIGVHSKQIRFFLQEGLVRKAASFLGRNYTIIGEHIRGQGIGAQKLLATINVQAHNYFMPKEGVYAAYTIINKNKYKSVVFVGKRLCTDGAFAIESHILQADFDIKSNEVAIEFIDFIRANMFFADLADLKAQMQTDIYQANKILRLFN